MHVLVAVVVGLALAGSFLRSFVAGTPDIATAATVFCGIFVQAIPFLALGILVSGAVAAFVTPDRLARWLPRRPAAAILAAVPDAPARTAYLSGPPSLVGALRRALHRAGVRHPRTDVFLGY